MSFANGAEGSIQDLKEAVYAQHGFLPEQQTLVFKGKLLKEGTLAENAVDDSMFIVLMVKKLKKQVEAPVVVKASPEAVKEASGASPPTEGLSTPETAGPTSTPEGAPSKPAATGGKVDALGLVMSVGFTQADAEQALAAAQNDPDRAVEFLFMSGVTPSEQTEPTNNSETSADIFAREDAAIKADPAGPLAELASTPEFQHMLQMVRQNPEALPLVMAEVEARWPDLVQTLEENQEELQKLLAEPAEPSKQAQIDSGAEMAKHEESIAMLVALFPNIDKELVAQAYHQCGCNQEMAANVLLSEDMSGFSTN